MGTTSEDATVNALLIVCMKPLSRKGGFLNLIDQHLGIGRLNETSALRIELDLLIDDELDVVGKDSETKLEVKGKDIET